MKRTSIKGEAPLTKKDQGFLRFLNQGSYTSASTLQFAQRDKLREGDGVYRKRRLTRSIYKVARYVK